VGQEIGWAFGLVALSTAVLAPAAEWVTAQVGDRRESRGRYLIMAAVPGVPILFHLLFGVLFSKCPDGYPC
jgi:hypothetical protein